MMEVLAKALVVITLQYTEYQANTLHTWNLHNVVYNFHQL